MSNKAIKIENKTAFVSGANRGIGKAITEELIAKGVKKVFLGVRNPSSTKELEDKYGDKVETVSLDVSNQTTVDNLPDNISEVDILINNAGVLVGGNVEAEDAETSLKQNLEVNLYGVIRLSNKFLPILKSKPQAALATVGSVVSLASMPLIGTYSISKAAVQSVIQAYRAYLVDNNILVSGIYPGPIETDMTDGFELDMDSPTNVAKAVVAGLENGDTYIYPDKMSVEVGAVYASAPIEVEKMFSEYKEA
jgi:short-subunit dehydrogenase